jgi:RNA polymerase sigma-70 factor (ECF subfamily)
MLETRSEDAGTSPAPPGSLEAIFVAKESALLRYAQRLVRHEEAAQDIVQEAFMKLHAEFAAVRQPEAWLYRTTHNLALNHLRARQKTDPQPGEVAAAELADAQPLPDEHIERMEAIGQTRLCLAALDPRRQELLRLKFEEDLSYQEISQRTRLTPGNVGYLLHHALKDLAAALKKTGVLP